MDGDKIIILSYASPISLYMADFSSYSLLIIPSLTVLLYCLLRLEHIEKAYEWSHILFATTSMVYVSARVYAGVWK